jgi:ADP-dependent NAD(P)H-hydrate dehydratase / NAD(P)H-hydrate epimerase
MKILTAAEMREVDRMTTERLGIPSSTLMENAGAGVAGFCAKTFPALLAKQIVVLCGKGNNGGDGFVAARHLKQMGAGVEVWLAGKAEDTRGDAAANLARWKERGGELTTVSDAVQWREKKEKLRGARIVIDALLGTGLHGPVEGWLAEVIQDVNALRPAVLIVAVDIPSGLSSDSAEVSGPAVRADYTVTFTAPKRGELFAPASENVGLLRVQEIGSPAEMINAISKSSLRWLARDEFSAVPLRRDPASNKGNYGHALVVAGSKGKSGAAVLSGWAALRTGAGLVTVGTPEPAMASVAAPVPELMTAPLSSTEAGSVALRNWEGGEFAKLLKGKTVLAMGPGLTTQAETQEFVRRVVKECPLPLVLDADGLNAFAGRGKDLREHTTAHLVLTPHPGEMARLVGCSIPEVQASRIEMALRHAAEWNAWVVLKGFQTVIAAPDGRAWINSTGNPGMATAGTGDVLTGMLAGFVAEFGVERWVTALTFGVYMHGLAGDIAAEKLGEESLTATDLIRSIPAAWGRMRAELERD